MASVLDKYIANIEETDPVHYLGHVTAVRGMLVESFGPRAKIGEMCSIAIRTDNPEKTARNAEVVGLDGKTVKLMVFGETTGIEIGAEVSASGYVLQVGVGDMLLGRVINALGKAADSKPEIVPQTYYPALASPPPPLDRTPVSERIVTGVRAIDALLAMAKGQRIGIFAGSGVGKSTLLSMIARNTNADVNVLALVGERGREVLDFIERDLGEEGMKRSVVVVATSDMSSIERLRAAYVATSVAEYFRDCGKDVTLMFDNVSRFAHAQREIGLAAGEPPAQRGYPPSVFDLIPKLLERSGTSRKGSITGFYAVLADGDDMDDPIVDKVRGTLDGHIVLSRALAQQNHFPAIDINMSISRLAKRVSGKATQEAVGKIRRLMAAYSENEDMITVGAYQKGANAAVDKAIDLHEKIETFLVQEEYEASPIDVTLKRLGELGGVEIPESEYLLDPDSIE
ncbi:MAG: flagellar protein export ATPase FliI [Treponemataceae bacterium]|nr:MAG: flagellar protein export ATPase FliI [Treponemataceae bacterium]